MDVLEIDAASNRGIDEIRALRESVKFMPVEGRKKVFIIDEAHMLTTEAWNALLKTKMCIRDSLCTNAFFTATFSLVSHGFSGNWVPIIRWWRHANAAHWWRSHTHSIHRRRCTT